MALILVIDDDATMCLTLTKMLGNIGHEVVVKSNANDGLAHIKANKDDLPALVITDVMMEDMDGLELLWVLRADYPTLPVVVMSGGGSIDGELDVLDDAEKMQADAVLRKPITKTTLEQTLKTIGI